MKKIFDKYNIVILVLLLLLIVGFIVFIILCSSFLDSPYNPNNSTSWVIINILDFVTFIFAMIIILLSIIKIIHSIVKRKIILMVLPILAIIISWLISRQISYYHHELILFVTKL